MKHFPKLSLVLGIYLGITSCADSDSNNPRGGPLSGVAVDGYLVGSRVTCDTNRNGLADSNEAFTLTDQNGRFTFAAGCYASVIITGGMNTVSDSISYPFLGNLTAPKGSSVVSPLTSVLSESSLSSSQMSELLGLPEDTDITQTDPTSDVNLFKTTLAIGQMTQKLSEVFGATPGCTTGYNTIAALIGQQLANEAKKPVSQRTRLFNNDGTVNNALLVTVATDVNTYFKNVITPAELLQVVAEIKTQSEQFLDPLVTVIDEIEVISEELQDPELPPVVTVSDDNYLFLKNDALKINGIEVTYADFASPSGANTSAINAFNFDFDIVGAPVIDTTVSIVLTMNEIGGTSRILEMMLSDVVMKNVAGVLKIEIPVSSHVYVYGHTGTGEDTNLIINNLSANFISLDPLTNEASLKYSEITRRILNVAADVDKTTQFEELLDLNGTYDTKIVISGLNIRKTDGKPLPVFSLGVTNARDNLDRSVGAVTGYGWKGKLVVAL